ncbi:hypothetical protein DV712_17485 [Parageobacillus thermoglucosidasius]|uniref:T7SS effector LXG polymorphic toxin n=1 Tax=Parageobacillus thermoglucosidasius TaxID=1426 RepID=UPI000E16B198|nr:T7SS effector LXG polymorphic toxin [Parageobacillus thermoglucosidasius]RDE21869.1 hypothetical protein DV712_17485 [Parageobacillus thermoglucosidasius]
MKVLDVQGQGGSEKTSGAFWKAMKVLDVQGLHEAIDKIISELQRKNAQMKNIRQSIQQFISLEGSLKGKGGEAIRNYYEDVHIPFLTYWEMFSEEFEAVLKQMKMVCISPFSLIGKCFRKNSKRF